MSKILIVDDDPHVREALCAVLAAEGHATIEVGNAKDARHVLFEGTESFDLVLLDLWLPEESGLNILGGVSEVVEI